MRVETKEQIRRNRDGLQKAFNLQNMGLQALVSGEPCDLSVGYEMKLDGSRCSMALHRMSAPHGGFVIEIERNSTWKYPQIDVHYLDDMWHYINPASGYGTSGNHAPRKVAIQKLWNHRENVLSVKQAV